MSFNIASKIRKLMTLAERGEGNEAEVAAATAQRLMREHAISMASLKETEILEQDPMMELAFEVGQSSWKIQLAWAVAEYCQVSALRATRWTTIHPVTGEDLGDEYKRRVFAWGYGHSSDLEVWEYLYEVAVRQIESEARKYAKTLHTPDFMRWGTKALFNVDGAMLTKREEMNCSGAGAVAGLSHKLRVERIKEKNQARAETEAQAAAEAEGKATPAESTETAVAVQEQASRYKRADEFMRGKNPKLGSGYRGGVGSSSAGVSAGKSISLNKGVGGGRGPKLLGC